MPYPQGSPMATDEIRSLRVDGLPPMMDAVYLFNCFYDNAEVLAATVLHDCQTGNHEDYGFVEFASNSVADFVLNSYNGELMPNFSNERYCLSWDTDNSATRWRWDSVFHHCSFFGYDEWGKELDASTVIDRYRGTIPVVGVPVVQHAANQNAQRDDSKCFKLTDIILIPYPNMYVGGYAGNQIYQHPGPSLTIQQNQQVQTQWNGGCGAGFIQNNMMRSRPHHINVSHGGLVGCVNYQQHDLYPQAGYVDYQQHGLYPQAGYVNYQQHDLFPQAGYTNYQQHGLYRQTCAYRPPYQQLQTLWTVGSDARTLGLFTQAPKRDLKRVCSMKKEKELYLCFNEINKIKRSCYVFRTIKLSELLACSCAFSIKSFTISQCKYCAKKTKPESLLRQRAWLFTGEKVPPSCGGEEARIPQFMGCCVSGSQFFFAGGIAPKLDQRKGAIFVPSGEVYSFVPESTSWQKHDWSFRKEKPDPLLLEVNGNFYCLAGRPFVGHLEQPTFEVYNSSTRDCEPLPDPPFPLFQTYMRHKKLAYAIVGTKILVSSKAGRKPSSNIPISCFDVKDKEKKWREMTTLFDGKPFPFVGKALVLDLNGATSDKVMFSFREGLLYISRLVVNGNGDISISHDEVLEFSAVHIFMHSCIKLSHDFVDLGNKKVGLVLCGSLYEWGEDDIDPLRKMRVVVVVIHYEADSKYLRSEIQTTRCFEYKSHCPGIISCDVVGSFVV